MTDTSTGDIPSAVQEMIGITKERQHTVTQLSMHRFAQAIGLDEMESQADGCLIAPPLFCQVFMFDDVPLRDLPADGSPKELDIPIPATRAVGGESDFEIFEEIKAGDVITVCSTLKSVEAKQGRSGPLYLVVVETSFQNQQGVTVARETATYVKR